MSWDVMNGYIENIYIYKVDNTIDLNKYKHYKIIHGKVPYVYTTYEMDDWNRTRNSYENKETPNGIWIVSDKPINELKEYRFKGE